MNIPTKLHLSATSQDSSFQTMRKIADLAQMVAKLLAVDRAHLYAFKYICGRFKGIFSKQHIGSICAIAYIFFGCACRWLVRFY